MSKEYESFMMNCRTRSSPDLGRGSSFELPRESVTQSDARSAQTATAAASEHRAGGGGTE